MELSSSRAFAGALVRRPAKCYLPGIYLDVNEHSFAREAICVLWTIALILIVLWLLGFSFHIGGGLIHLLLVIGLIVLVVQLFQMFTGRRAA